MAKAKGPRTSQGFPKAEYIAFDRRWFEKTNDGYSDFNSLMSFFFYLCRNARVYKSRQLMMDDLIKRTDLATGYGLKYSSFKTKLTGLVKAGFIQRESRGIYLVNDNNVRFIMHGEIEKEDDKV